MYSGCCPCVARSFNRLGLEELFTAIRKAWFPLASKAKSGNLVAVSFKFGRVELSQGSLARILNDGAGSEEAGVITEQIAKRTGTKNLNMIMDRPVEMNDKQRKAVRGKRSREEEGLSLKVTEAQAFNAARKDWGMAREELRRGPPTPLKSPRIATRCLVFSITPPS